MTENNLNELASQRILMEAQMIQQMTEQAEAEIKAIDERIDDMNNLAEGIEGIKKNYDKEIMFPISNGIFMKATPKSKELLVNVGSNVAVIKTPEGAVRIINGQIKRLSEMKKTAEIRLLENTAKMQELIQELYKGQKE
ncbi:prefoldin subunit alpha [Candidatus Pacearchaeota archaeon CG10_big_fil_rev_8_21_14_0_10_35_13]|nr:MAG: prefoldin subunit alpha [Candidatus Pacearchaeota archaeon CG10_big_fil_rev_8_21_14_0_10_35_13]